MSGSPRSAAIVFGLELGVMLLALILWAVGVHQPMTPDIALFPAAYLAFGAVGALIISRQPGHRIGRLALASGALGALVGLVDSVGRLSEPVPGQAWAAWIATWGFPTTLAPPLLLLLSFPTGRLASPRWRVAAALVVGGVALLVIGNAFTPAMPDFPSLRNPVGIDAFTGSPLESGGVGWFPVLGGAIAAGVGLVPRLHRARGVERQQLKWMTYAAALHASAWLVLAADLPGTAGEIAGYAVFGTLLLIPVGAGIAILRYRLYDIDVVIRRTLVYGAVVGVLGTLYVSLVVGLQTVLAPLTGGDTLPVALSTLAIAALFGPVRSRLRELVDRRFYRSRYDAQRVAESFAGRLRDEVDLESVGHILVDAVGRTVRPAAVGLWLRDPHR